MWEGSLLFDTVSHETVVVVTARGTLNGTTSSALSGVLRKRLAGHPDALVLDLAAVAVEDRASLLVLTAVARQASLWPAVPFAVVESRPEVVRSMHRLGIPRSLALIPSVAAALEVIDQGGARPSVREVLPPISGAARHARTVVTGACLEWGFADLVGPACAVVTEFVANATRHAGTTMTLRISRRSRWLLLAVEDGGTGVPEALPMPGADDGGNGRGLALVDALSHRWGWLPSDSGKVVWAVLGV
ncbi:ATP-binding protein [Asanoa siamensis]|uniref:Anti-anti-sigma factor n=1 Tax=Asanoa siamensis TaxID=926357 RepID=A0ABQ4CRW4_9ACTN|nr:ATP-binding protein [Asanoa siamensis]GIF74041.1 anti-anti-sigma factor [Asanoa siamensis]